jgi:hypothetical protein
MASNLWPEDKSPLSDQGNGQASSWLASMQRRLRIFSWPFIKRWRLADPNHKAEPTLRPELLRERDRLLEIRRDFHRDLATFNFGGS